jgi:hypothetical protein
LATVKLSDPPAANFDIGSVFAHESVRGRIALHNDSASEITLGEVNTSCGCAAAVPTDKKIASGQTAHLIINYLPGAPGGKSFVLGATVSGKRFELFGKSNSLAPIVTEPTVIRVVDGHARVKLKVVDTRIDLQHAKLTIIPSLFTIESRMSKDTVDCEITATRLPAVLPDTISIIVNDGKDRSVDLRVSYPGRFQISPRLLLVSKLSPTIRIVAIGEMAAEGLQQKENGVSVNLEISGRKIEPAKVIEIRITDGAAILTLENPFTNLEPGRYEVRVPAWNSSFTLSLRSD